MVPGEYPEATGIVRQHLGDPELHGEVGDARRHGLTVTFLLLIPQRAAQIVGQIRREFVEFAQESGVDRQFVEASRFHRAQQRDRVLSALRPQPGVDGLEQVLSRLLPRPPQVRRQWLQGG